MHESKELKPSDPSAASTNASTLLPIPRTMGIFSIIITFLAFTVGSIRNELVLILVGVVFLSILGYCFLTILGLSCILRKRVRSVSVRVITKQVAAGNNGEVSFSLGTAQHNRRGNKFFRFPGILIRYELRLETKDARCIHHIFDPDVLRNGISLFPVPKRGAYYAQRGADEFAIFDMLGFFRFSFSIHYDPGPRILATPKAAVEILPVAIRAGGTAHRREPKFLRTDNLNDHRPYIPGDDPRRINWKLYGHLGDLFVREGEPEPPPHSQLLIVVDTYTDSSLYTPEGGRRGMDLLCENALALAIEYADRGMDIRIGYAGGGIQGGTLGELAAALAYPAAASLCLAGDIPCPPECQGVLILALPREAAEPTGLDRFLKKQGSTQRADLVFLYEEGRLDSAAETCVGIYSQKRGIQARRILIDQEERIL